MSSAEKGRYEMNWDCPGCGTTALLGLSHRHCPNCGAPQDPTRRYFPAPGTEVAVADHPFQGVDVQCPACDTPNAAKATFCVGCGSPLEGAKTVRTREEQSASRGVFSSDSAADAAREAEAARRRERAAQAAAHARASGAAAADAPAVPAAVAPAARTGLVFKGVAALGCLGFGVLVVSAFAVFFLWKKDAAFVVTGHTWERTVAVETYGPVSDSAWRDQVPAGAYGLSCRSEQRSTKSVPDGETCVDKRRDKGDGTFAVVQECTPRTREEPVYDDKCTYTVDQWRATRTERAGGSSLAPAPTWPSVRLARSGQCLGCERAGARAETYTVQLQDAASKAAHGCDLPEARWRAMAVGSRWIGSVGVISGLLDCDALAPAAR